MLDDLFIKASKQKICNQIIKKMRLLCANDYIDESIKYRNVVKELIIPKDIEKVIEFIIYNATEDKTLDVTKVSKIINKQIEKIDFNLVDYFKVLFIKDNLLLRETFLQSELGKFESSINIMLVHYSMEYINVVKFRQDKRRLIGVDIANNKVKYATDNMYFDTHMSVMRCQEDVDIINKYKKYVLMQYEIADKTNSNIDETDTVGQLLSVYDRLDDSVRTFRSTVIMADILTQISRIEFSRPNIDRCKECLKLNAAIKNDTELLTNRKRLTASRGTLIKNDNISVLFKEVAFDDYVFIIGEYTLKDTNISNTIIIPISEQIIIQDTNIEALYLMYDYYTNKTDKLSILPVEYWKDRKKNYEGHEKDRHYFEREIEPFIRKANNASEHAKELAKKYQMNLPEGYTLVDKFTRRYNKDLIDNTK